jgi:hypothetical protein
MLQNSEKGKTFMSFKNFVAVSSLLKKKKTVMAAHGTNLESSRNALRVEDKFNFLWLPCSPLHKVNWIPHFPMHPSKVFFEYTSFCLISLLYFLLFTFELKSLIENSTK